MGGSGGGGWQFRTGAPSVRPSFRSCTYMAQGDGVASQRLYSTEQSLVQRLGLDGDFREGQGVEI